MTVTLNINETLISLALAGVGSKGDSAYQVAVNNGFVGTEAEWLASLNGTGGVGSGDMLKSTYDTNNNGVVDNAEKVNGLTVQTAVPSGAVFTDTVYTLPTDVPHDANYVHTDNNYSNAEKAKVASALQSVTKADIGLGNVDNTSDANKPVSTAQQTALNLKVDKVTGKGLSTNDYTTLEQTKLSGIESGAQVNTVVSVAGKNGTVTLAKTDVGLSNVQNADTTTTANITDSTNKRFMTDAEKVVLDNTSNINTGDETLSTIKNKLGITILSGANSGDQDLSGYATTTALATTNSNVSANTAAISTKQDTLVNQTNIKSINGQSLLGSGNMVISGGSSSSPNTIISNNFKYFYSGSTITGNSTSIGVGTLSFRPLEELYISTTISAFGVRVLSTIAMTLNIGLYSADALNPLSLTLVQQLNGCVVTTTQADYVYSLPSNITLDPSKIYWIAIETDTANMKTDITNSTNTVGKKFGGVQIAHLGGVWGCINVSHTFGALPSTYTLSMATTYPYSPLVAFKQV